MRRYAVSSRHDGFRMSCFGSRMNSSADAAPSAEGLSMSKLLTEALERVDAARLCRAHVVSLTEMGTIIMELADAAQTRVESALLMTADASTLTLHRRDEVLVWLPAENG